MKKVLFAVSAVLMSGAALADEYELVPVRRVIRGSAGNMTRSGTLRMVRRKMSRVRSDYRRLAPQRGTCVGARVVYDRHGNAFIADVYGRIVNWRNAASHRRPASRRTSRHRVVLRSDW